MASLEAMPPMPYMGDLREDALKSLDAELRYHAGDLDGALAVLRTITFEAPHGATYHAFADGTRARFLRAELELERGDREVALGLYRGLDESWSPYDIYHRPIVYQRLGEIAEAEGRTADAIEFYSRLVDLWRDTDPALIPARTAIQQRREALRGPR
jgi:tetratricopeptide (TPR) repeat protein